MRGCVSEYPGDGQATGTAPCPEASSPPQSNKKAGGDHATSLGELTESSGPASIQTPEPAPKNLERQGHGRTREGYALDLERHGRAEPVVAAAPGTGQGDRACGHVDIRPGLSAVRSIHCG